MELAYALTVHKAQGSQFKLVILVLPEGHPIMSRELVYTALSRHQDRVVVMHQGPRTMLKDFAAPFRSEREATLVTTTEPGAAGFDSGKVQVIIREQLGGKRGD